MARRPDDGTPTPLEATVALVLGQMTVVETVHRRHTEM
jgi:hypothetical protein